MAHCGWATCASILLALLALPGCGAIKAEIPGLVPASHVDAPSAVDAVVVFVRPSAQGEGYAFPIVDESGNVLGYSGAESQFAIHVAPGERTLRVLVHGQAEEVDADVAPGRTYYVLVELVHATTGARWTLTPVPADQLGSAEVQTKLHTPSFHLDPARIDHGTIAPASSSKRSAKVLRAGDGR
jgi:hypothetical protein